MGIINEQYIASYVKKHMLELPKVYVKMKDTENFINYKM